MLLSPDPLHLSVPKMPRLALSLGSWGQEGSPEWGPLKHNQFWEQVCVCVLEVPWGDRVQESYKGGLVNSCSLAVYKLSGLPLRSPRRWPSVHHGCVQEEQAKHEEQVSSTMPLSWAWGPHQLGPLSCSQGRAIQPHELPVSRGGKRLGPVFLPSWCQAVATGHLLWPGLWLASGCLSNVLCLSPGGQDGMGLTGQLWASWLSLGTFCCWPA